MARHPKIKMRPHVPWRPSLTDEQVRELAALVPDGHFVSIYPQRPGLYRIHLFREGKTPPLASRHEVTGSWASYIRMLVEEAGVAA